MLSFIENSFLIEVFFLYSLNIIVFSNRFAIVLEDKGEISNKVIKIFIVLFQVFQELVLHDVVLWHTNVCINQLFLIAIDVLHYVLIEFHNFVIVVVKVSNSLMRKFMSITLYMVIIHFSLTYKLIDLSAQKIILMIAIEVRLHKLRKEPFLYFLVFEVQSSISQRLKDLFLVETVMFAEH
jgi:hypothetical protein